MKILQLFRFLGKYMLAGLLVAGLYLGWQTGFDRGQFLALLNLSPQMDKSIPNRQDQMGPFSYARAVQTSAPSVVTIYTSKTVKQTVHPLFNDPLVGQLFGDQIKKYKRDKTETNLGSGVIITYSGYILTNQHVIDGAEEILISLSDGRSSRATLVGEDRDTDIAVLHIPLKGLQRIHVAENNDPIQVGDVVLAIGNPLNVGQTVTMGIISATGRNRIGLNTFENFIQTDAAINPGNSGGALINAKGDLIGINTAIFSQSGGSQGIGFAIPVGLAFNVMDEIIKHGKVSRGWLGVEGTEVTARAALESGNPNVRGVLIVGVFIGSPADNAGVETGDIITAINGYPVSRVRNVLEIISAHKPGDVIQLRLLREGKELELMMVAIERPQ